MKLRFLQKFATFSAFFALAAPQTQAQKGLPNFLKRWEVGFTYDIASATYKSTETAKASNGAIFTTNVEENVTSKIGYGGFMGTYVPLKRIGSTLLAIGINAQYKGFIWDYSMPTFQGFRTDENGNPVSAIYRNDLNLGISAMSMQLAAPLTLDLKMGGEASLLRDAKWTSTIGVGAYPSLSMTANYGGADFGFAVTPFAKAEIGMKGGIFWKLRVQYAFGDMPLYTGNRLFDKDSGFGADSELLGKSVLSVGLVLMPFSWNFKEDGWWNWHH